MQKQHTITQTANQEYQHALQKANRNPQGGKKLSLELSSHYQKRVVTNARREFDVLFDVATALQEKVLLYLNVVCRSASSLPFSFFVLRLFCRHLHAGLLAQISFHEQATIQFTSNRESVDTVQNYLQTVERARWMKSILGLLCHHTTFSSTSHSLTPSLLLK